MNNRSITKSQSMANVSIGLGIASFVCLFMSMMTLATAPLGIIMALLSREEDRRLSRNARFGIILCLVSYAIAVFMIVSTVLLLVKSAGGWEQFIQYVILRIQTYLELGA